MTEPGWPGTKGESNGTLPGGSAEAPPARFRGPESVASHSSREEKADLHWAALNRRMDRLRKEMQARRARLSPPGPGLVPPLKPPPPPAESEEEPAERPASAGHVACPRCSGRVHPSRAHSLFEHLLKVLGSRPMRCHSCYYRYAEFMGVRLILKN